MSVLGEILWLDDDRQSINQWASSNQLYWCLHHTHLKFELPLKHWQPPSVFTKTTANHFIESLFNPLTDIFMDIAMKDIRKWTAMKDFRKQDPKLPFAECHTQQTFAFCVNKLNSKNIMRSAALLTGYALLLWLRGIDFSPKSVEKSLINKSINWHPAFCDPKEMSIKVKASKTNGWGYGTEIIYASCNWNEITRIIPCPVHYLKYWILARNKLHKTTFDTFLKNLCQLNFFLVLS